MIRRKVIVEFGGRGEKTNGDRSYSEQEIYEWLERNERYMPYFGDYKDKLTIIYEEEQE